MSTALPARFSKQTDSLAGMVRARLRAEGMPWTAIARRASVRVETVRDSVELVLMRAGYLAEPGSMLPAGGRWIEASAWLLQRGEPRWHAAVPGTPAGCAWAIRVLGSASRRSGAIRPRFRQPEPERRLEAALAELAEAIRAEVRDELAAETRGPERLLSVDEAAAAAGIGRSTLYGLISSGGLRSVKIGRRRLVPASAIAQLSRQ